MMNSTKTAELLRQCDRERLALYIKDLRLMFNHETETDKLFALLAAISGLEDYLKLL